MAAITSTNVANAIVKLVAADALPALVGNLVMGNLVNRDYEPSMASGRRHDQRADSADAGGQQSGRGRNGADAESEPGQCADRAEHSRGSHLPDSGRDESAGGSGPAADLYAAGGCGAGREDRDRPAGPVRRIHVEPGGGTAGVAINEVGDRCGRNGAVPGQGSGDGAEVPGGGRQYLLAVAADSALQRVPDAPATPDCGRWWTGTVGKIKDFFVFRSQFVQKTGSGPATTHNLAFTKNAIGLVIRRHAAAAGRHGRGRAIRRLGNFGMRVVMSYQPNTLAQQFTVDVLYGVAVLRNEFGVRVLS